MSTTADLILVEFEGNPAATSGLAMPGTDRRGKARAFQSFRRGWYGAAWFGSASPHSTRVECWIPFTPAMRNVSVLGFRTSIRLESQIWDSLAEICRREFCTLHDVCSYVAIRKPPHSSLTSSLRIFILDYFRASATEDGHRTAGHGQGMFLAEQQKRLEMRGVKAARPDGSNGDPDGTKVGADMVQA